MTYSMFAPPLKEAVSGGDPHTAASTPEQQLGVLAVDSLIANAASGRFEAPTECSTSGLVSVQHEPRSNALPQNNNLKSEEHCYNRLLDRPYSAGDMQPAATQFYLNFNPAFAPGQFGPTTFGSPYMTPHYAIPSSFNQYNQLQPQQSRSTGNVQQQSRANSRPIVPASSSLAQSNSYNTNCSGIGYSNPNFGDVKCNLDSGSQGQRGSAFGLGSDRGGDSSFPARPQPQRAVPGSDLSLGLTGLTSNNSPPNSSDRSQSSPSSTTTITNSSVAAYRDKIGLQSPTMNHASPLSNTPGATCQSPATDARCPSRSSNTGNAKFRYPSGPSSTSISSSPHQSVGGEGGCATPHSAMSSREGTPIPPPQKLDEPSPNVDISRVQIDESEKRPMLQHQSGFIKTDPKSGLAVETQDFRKQDSTGATGDGSSFNFMKQSPMYQKQEQPTFNENFQKYIQEGRDQQQQVMIHQQQQMLHSSMQHQQYPGFATTNNNPLSPSTVDGTNNNLLASQSITLQQRANNLYGHPASRLHATPYQAGYGSTIHHYGSSGVVGSNSAMGVSAHPGAGRPAAAVSRGGSQVKIGRRPSHLPKVLKFQDSNLPPGWVRKLKCRKHGKQAGRWDVYIYSPCGVKFASRKKLKSFFEKNNLNYDPEDFDFTPYGRHSDHGSSTRGGGASSSNSGRHNSSGSTGSEATHPGSSPASLVNYSPTHIGSSTTTSSYISSSMVGTFGNSLNDYIPFSTFDPLMEGPPNTNALDVQRMDSYLGTTSTCATSTTSGLSDGLASTGRTTLEYHPGRGHHHPLKTEPSDNNFIDMSDFFGDSSTAVAVAAALPLHNGTLYLSGSPVTNQGVNSDFSDLTQETMVSGRGSILGQGMHPMSEASLGSRCSEDETEDCSKSQDMSDLGKAFTVMNDEYSYT